MSYLGNSPEVNTYAVGVEKFNGTGACTQFTLARSIDDPNYLEVVVGGVQLTPTNQYTVSAGVVTFATPPALGTSNIVIIHRTGTTLAYNQISAAQVLANSITATAIAPSSVTNSKIAAGAITGDKLTDGSIASNNIVVGGITGNLIAPDAVTTNHIVTGAITGNLLAPNIITSNNIVDGSILGNDLGLYSVSGNNIGVGSVSGNNIGTGAISANHFSGGGVTSETLSPNLSVSVSRTLETAVVSGSGASGTINLDVLSSSVQYYDGTTSANVTFNVRGNSSYSFYSITQIGQTTSVAAIVKHTSGSGGRYVCFLTIDGSTPTIVYAANGKPGYTTTMVASTETNIFTWSILKIGSGTYRVFASNTIFGSA